MIDMYKGKEFYEVTSEGLVGPLDNIFFCNNVGESHKFSEYQYVQIIDGRPVRAFTKDEIVVRDSLAN